MSLPETAERVLPSVVALASLAIPESLHFGPGHGMPQVIGTQGRARAGLTTAFG